MKLQFIALWAFLGANVAMAKPKPEPAPAPAPAPGPAPAPAPAPEPPPAPPEPVAPKNNADIRVDLAFADGTHKTGHVVRIERGTDWYAESGWEDSAAKLTITMEADGSEVEKAWTDVKDIGVVYGSKDTLDCFYESNFDPAMYTCVLKTTATAHDKAGKTYNVTSRYKWRFTFDDGSTAEFYLYKLPNRAPDDQTPDLNSANTENQALYAKLQTDVLATAKKSVTKITVQ